MIEWIKVEDDSLAFNVALNTHSVDLDQYDLGNLVVLRDNTGNEYQAEGKYRPDDVFEALSFGNDRSFGNSYH